MPFVACKLNRAGARVQALASSYPFCLIVLLRWTGQRLFSLVSVDEVTLYRDAQGMPGRSPLGWPPSLVRLSTLCLLPPWLHSHEITAKKLIHHSEKVCSSPKRMVVLAGAWFQHFPPRIFLLPTDPQQLMNLDLSWVLLSTCIDPINPTVSSGLCYHICFSNESMMTTLSLHILTTR